ncbi:MAG TPA: beta-propeller fold lactonase family protein [Thermoleophilaceae bacterium]|nr:beta-propeller fold lactonase family protein [Thermoleophilaceae bacterium]
MQFIWRALARRPFTASLLATAIGAGAALAPTPALAAGGDSVVGHVYLDDNTAGANTIAAFDRHADGSLTPVAGSPFSAGGAGTGSGLASQGAIQITDDGHFLLAVDAGSNQISVLKVNKNGSLKPVDVTSSGGSLPVSITVHRKLVYVANAADGGANYTGFRLAGDGSLSRIPHSTVPLPDGSQPGDIFFNGTGTKVVGTRINSSLIDSFVVAPNGRLVAAPGSPFAAQGVGPFGSEFRPTNPNQVFVSNAHDGALAGTVSAFNDLADGTLSSIGASPFPDHQTAACWVEITRDGNVLFTVNTGSGSISSYSIAADGALTLLGSTPVSAERGVGAVDARLTPDNGTLYVDESRVGTVAGFAVDGGNLTELASSPTALPVGAAPAGLVVD